MTTAPFLVAVLVSLLAGTATAATAHEAPPGIRSVVDDVRPAVAGLVVEVHTSIAPQVVVAVAGEEAVTFLDPDGRPFLRVGPDGVEGDVGLAAFYSLHDPTGAPPPAGAVRDDPDAGPVWSRLSAEPTWGWFDHRMHPARATGAPATADGDDGAGPATLAEWRIPFRAGDVDGEVRGRIVTQPVRGRAVAELDRIDVDGVELSVLDGRVPGLFLANRSGEDVTVHGVDGEVLLVFGGDGSVRANLASPSWWAHARASSSTPLPDVAADASVPPALVEVATSGTFGWLAPHAAFEDDEPADATVPAVLRRWSVPVTVGAGAPLPVAGRTVWIPRAVDAEQAAAAAAGGPTGPEPAAIVALLVGTAAVLAVGRRRRDRTAGGPARVQD